MQREAVYSTIFILQKKGTLQVSKNFVSMFWKLSISVSVSATHCSELFGVALHDLQKKKHGDVGLVNFRLLSASESIN